MSRVKITALSPQTIERIDKELCTKSWRDDSYEIPVGQGIFDVEISDDCTVTYVNGKLAGVPVHSIELLMNGKASRVCADDFHQIIGM